MTSYKVKLTKIRSNHSNLRTDTVEGVVQNLPEVGSTLQLVGEGLEFGNRLVYTTEIKNVEQIDNTYQFNTLNSVYKLEVLEEIVREK